MPEEVEVETKDLQETIEELQEERKEREEEVRQSAWTRYIGLSTAILAVFAAIGALQSGALVNGAMMDQLKASDTWNEYQAARQKDHLYTIEANHLLDAGARPPSGDAASSTAPAGALPPSHGGGAGEGHASPGKEHGASTHAAGGGGPHGEGKTRASAAPRTWKGLPPDARLASYIGKASDEANKEAGLQEKATELQSEAKHQMHQHHQFAYSVALIQVAIALSAVAALTKIKPVWYLSLAAGAIGIVFFAMGFLPK